MTRPARITGVPGGVSGLVMLLCHLGYPEPAMEVRFHPRRRWRWDVAWEGYKVALERQGGTYAGGRHSRGKGYAADCEKTVEGQLLGWLVVPYCVDHEESGLVVEWVERALRARGWEGTGCGN